MGWTPGGVAPAVCACVRHDVKRGPGRSERAVQVAVVRYDMNGNRDGSMAGSTRGWA